MRPDRLGRPRGLRKAGLQPVIVLNALPVLKSKFLLHTWVYKGKRTCLLLPEMNQTGARAGVGRWGTSIRLWCSIHRAGLAHRLLTSAVSFSSAECSSHLATVQGNSHHHQLNAVWSNCTAFIYPLFPSLAPQPIHPTFNMVPCALG